MQMVKIQIPDKKESCPAAITVRDHAADFMLTARKDLRLRLRK